LGKLYIKSKRISEGIEILRRLSNFHEMNSERFLTIGNAYLVAGMGEEAEVLLEKGDDMTGHKDSRFNDGLAKAKIAQGDTKAALEVVGDRGFSDDVISYLNLRAIMCLKRNKLDEALAYYNQALSGAHIKVIKAKLYFNMGLAYARSGLLPKAKTAFEESLRLGTPKFDRATGPLKVIHNIEKSNASGSVTDDLMVEMEFDYENVG
jgi:tetratricopeptide (TPR) repeat protein